MEHPHGQGAVATLAVVADPRTLGELRDALPADVARLVTGTLAKDLVNRPIPEIAAALERG